MIVVVAFSSCLDVAAIEMEMGTPLDFNGELQTVKEKGVVVLLLLWAFCSAAVGRQPSFYNMMIFDFLFGVHIHRRRFLAVSWSAGRCLAVAALISAFFFQMARHVACCWCLSLLTHSHRSFTRIRALVCPLFRAALPPLIDVAYRSLTRLRLARFFRIKIQETRGLSLSFVIFFAFL